ncbi:hypothetical protein GMMP1_300006 [Candidatus Magnetomoraceae bacterium gMMP-1]
MKDTKKILIIAPNGIGDNLMFLPTAYNIKKAFPGIEIHFLANKSNNASTILKYTPYVDDVVQYQMKKYTIAHYLKFFIFQFFPLVLKLKKNQYDYILTVRPNLLRKSLFIFMKSHKWLINKN